MTDPRLVTSYSGGKATLRISEAELNDAGEYMCKASNSAGQESCRAKLSVQPSINGDVNGVDDVNGMDETEHEENGTREEGLR